MAQTATRTSSRYVLIAGLALIAIGVVVAITGYMAQNGPIVTTGWPIAGIGVLVVAVGAAISLLRR